MTTYYETTENAGTEYPIIHAHDTIEEAISFAEENGIELIHEMGGAFDTFAKCGFCGEWLPIQDLNENGWCDHCEWYTAKGRC